MAILNKLLEKLGFERTKDVWEENERLKSKLTLAEKRLAAAETNCRLMNGKYNAVTSVHNTAVRKYKDACLRVIELEGEVNTLYEGANFPLPYPRKEG